MTPLEFFLGCCHGLGGLSHILTDVDPGVLEGHRDMHPPTVDVEMCGDCV